MHINFYNENVEAVVTIPVLVYKITAKVDNPLNSNLDILGDTILALTEEGDIVSADILANKIGIPQKYKKLVQYEINELLDLKRLEIDETTQVVTRVYKDTVDNLEEFYVIYDKLNKLFLDCIIRGNEFNKFAKNKPLEINKVYTLKDENKNYKPDKYLLCTQLQDLINRSNEVANLDEDQINEDYDFKRPFYKIYLDNIENINAPTESEFLFKVSINKNLEIYFESPFSKDTDSVYIERNIIPRVKMDQIYKLAMKDEQINYKGYEDKSKKYVDIYMALDKDTQRIEYMKKICFNKAVLESHGDEYKLQPLAIIEVDKLLKSLLRELTYTFKESKTEKRNVVIENYCFFEQKDALEIIQSIKKQNIKVVYKGRKVINSFHETSIVSYLKCIYLSKFFTNNKNESIVYNIFTKEIKLIEFLNDVWLYRNNTSHNIERQKFYRAEYDMELMTKERLAEVMSALVDGIIYFTKTLKDLKEESYG